MNRATSTVRSSAPLVPVIVTVAGPTVAVLATVSVSSVSGPDVAGGLNAAVTPSGSPLAAKLTTPANPLLGTIEIVVVAGVALDQAQPRWVGGQEEVLRWRRVDEQGDVDGANQRAAGSDDGHRGGADRGRAGDRQREQRVRSGGDRRAERGGDAAREPARCEADRAGEAVDGNDRDGAARRVALDDAEARRVGGEGEVLHRRGGDEEVDVDRAGEAAAGSADGDDSRAGRRGARRGEGERAVCSRGRGRREGGGHAGGQSGRAQDDAAREAVDANDGDGGECGRPLLQGQARPGPSTARNHRAASPRSRRSWWFGSGRHRSRSR